MSQGQDKKMLIVNVDPGIDDAQALLMAFADPSFMILALCVHHGNTSIKNAISNTLKLLSAIGRTDIPVFRGSERALVTQPPKGDDYFGSDGFGDSHDIPSPDQESIKDEHAVLAMIRLVSEHPGEITMVALGPLTNLALAHRLDPEFDKKLKKCFIMGGNYKGRGNIAKAAEFNFYFDAESANIVLSEFRCPINLITWELCLESAMEWDIYDELRSHPTKAAKLMTKVESKLIETWKSRGSYVICDELAMAAALDENSMQSWIQTSGQVEMCSPLTRGQAVFDWNNKDKKPKNIRVVTKMNMDIVKNLLRRAYSKELVKARDLES